MIILLEKSFFFIQAFIWELLLLRFDREKRTHNLPLFVYLEQPQASGIFF